MSWNDVESKGVTWDELVVPSTEHPGGLRLRAPRGTDPVPMVFGEPASPMLGRTPVDAVMRAAVLIRWLVLEPSLTDEQAVELVPLVRAETPGDASNEAILGALPAAWLAYQRGER